MRSGEVRAPADASYPVDELVRPTPRVHPRPGPPGELFEDGPGRVRGRGDSCSMSSPDLAETHRTPAEPMSWSPCRMSSWPHAPSCRHVTSLWSGAGRRHCWCWLASQHAQSASTSPFTTLHPAVPATPDTVASRTPPIGVPHCNLDHVRPGRCRPFVQRSRSQLALLSCRPRSTLAGSRRRHLRGRSPRHSTRRDRAWHLRLQVGR